LCPIFYHNINTMDSTEDTANLTNNNSLKSRDYKKSKFISILFLLLLIAGIILYLLTGFEFPKKNPENITDSTPAENEDVRSPFGELAKNDDEENTVDVSPNKGVDYYIKLYDEYSMGEMGIRYVFKSFDENSMSLKLIERDQNGEVERDFPLAEDFLIVSTVFDISKYGLDFSRLDDMDKYSIAFESSSMTLEEKKNLLSSYPEGSTIALIFTDMNFDSNSKVKKILVTTTDGFR